MTIILCPPVFRQEDILFYSEVTHFMPNAKVLESKKATVDALAEKLGNATAAVFVDYKGINVAQDTELRNQFRAAEVEYTVVKNTLTRFAANKAGYTEFDELLNGTTSLACTTGDPIAPARIICEFAKKNKDIVKIKGGLVEGKVLSVDELKGLRRTAQQERPHRPGARHLPGAHHQPRCCPGSDLPGQGRRSRCGRARRSLILEFYYDKLEVIYNGIRKDHCYD